MSVSSGQSVVVLFTLRSPTTGVAANADSLPTAVLVVNGVTNAAGVTVANLATGRYKASVTLPTLAEGDIVEILATATVGGVADSDVIWDDGCDSNLAIAATNSAALVLMTTGTGGTRKYTTTALSNAPTGSGGGGGAGNGDIEVDHDTGGTDALRAEVMGSGISGVIVRAYLQSDYDTEPRVYAIQAEVTTNSDGRWSQPMMLAAGTYAITFNGGGIAWPVVEDVGVA